MINAEHNGNGVGVGVGSGGTAAPGHEKQLASSTKKTALRDVQNENVGSVHKQKENFVSGGGRASGDTIKVCGTKRLTPECPSSSKGLASLTYNNDANENIMNARRRFDLELGRGRLQNNVEKISNYSEFRKTGPLHHEIAQKINQMKDNNTPNVPVATSTNLAATMIFSSSGPSVPGSFGKHRNSTPVDKISSKFPSAIDSKITKDQLRTERFICLQKFLKQRDEADPREYIQVLLNSSPAELSKRAVELEKRAIQLTIEEGKEMQRMKALNILAKSSLANNLLQSTQ